MVEEIAAAITGAIAGAEAAGGLPESAFAARAAALDALESEVLDRIDGLMQSHPRGGWQALKARAEEIQRRLESVDAMGFARLHADIRAGGLRGDALRTLAAEMTGGAGAVAAEAIGAAVSGYDMLDAFCNGLLLWKPLPAETREREPEMVFYQKTPARVVFEIAREISEGDVFFDIGAGLGQAAILVHLLSGAVAKGVEFDPAFCDYANRGAADLKLARVEFLAIDARTADYSRGTCFFLYTPFEGRMLSEVMERLRSVAQARPIRVFTYGPCTPAVAALEWLEEIPGKRGSFGSFRSR